ncbi:transcription factor, MADS-box [Tanacetum coccineum]|uniref:Transcription factor, MADS-box n=1 Tax=Tanacetum coccineum TaxID=301880 RepID=A0ABQ4ZSF6_9ASTR
MGRVKIPMELINDSKKRKITFRRRKEGLIKKARELSTLCDVNVSMIICSDHQESPEIFPQDPVKLNDMINDYKTKRDSNPGKIKSYSLCDFFKDRKNKIEDELAKEKKRNLEAKFPAPFEFLDNSSEEQLRDFADRLGMKIDEVKTKNPLLELKKMSDFQNLGLQGWLKMPRLNPNPITTMTHFDYNKNDNTSIVDDDVESPGSSNRTSVHNSYYPIVPMDQLVFCTNERSMEALSTSLMKSEDVNDCYDGLKFDLKPEMMQQLEQPQNMDMQRVMLSCFY